MAYARRRPETGVVLLPPEDMFGRRSINGVRQLLGERRLRRWSKARHDFYHRAKNGIHDPLSYFHLLEELANLKPWAEFTSAELAEHLNKARPQFIWDAVTVGRILNDVIDTFAETNPNPRHQPLTSVRQWTGRQYMTTDYPESRALMAYALDDLARAGEAYLAQLTEGEPPKRIDSPLLGLPSLAIPVAADLEGVA